MNPRSRRRRWPRRLAVGATALVLVVAVVVVAFVASTRNPSVPAFYDPPADVSAAAGTVLRREEFDRGIPSGAEAWRVLYASTDPDGRPIAVSGLVIAPTDPPAGPRPVLAWAHGTSGIARACAPSLSDAPLDGIPDPTALLAQGWVLALTDYPGLGTPGPHPYLVGESAGRAVLDSVRAVHAMGLDLELDDRYAIWGHSQGGHAALFAGQLAVGYLPKYPLVGVAALAPATELGMNLAAVAGSRIGNVLTALAVESWTELYPDLPRDTLTSAARRPAERVARSCLNQPSRFRLLLDGLTLPDQVLALDPATDPAWSSRLAANAPDPGAIEAPLFVAQGLADDVIDPAVTAAWLSQRCAVADVGPTVSRTYAGIDHVEVVDPGGADAYAWTLDRLAGVAAPSGCVAD